MPQKPQNDALTPHTGPERRAYERFPVALFGRCMFANKLEIPCQAINISPGDMAAVIAHTPTDGEHLIVYLDNIGRVEGNVTRVFEGGFAMDIKASPRMREKLAAKIAWCSEKAVFGEDDARTHARLTPSQPMSEIRLEDGRNYEIEIIDISLSGAAIRSEVRPALGTKLSLGGMPGTVVRHFDEGLAIEFAVEQCGDELANKFI